LALPRQKIAVRPESEPKLSELVRKLIREADAERLLPTPLERLFEIAEVKNIEELPDDTFLQTLSEKAKSLFRSAKQKLRGIADLREKATYIPRDPNSGRERFVKAHELGHQAIPWHAIDPAYLDDDESLGPSAKGIFEHEANFFAAETIFQGKRFRAHARDYQPSFDAIFTLADKHGASRQSTAWRFVEDQDEAVALLQYYPGNAIDEDGNCVLYVWRSVGSPVFNQRYGEIDLPQVIRTGHPWAAARDLNHVCNGTENLNVDSHPVPFQWHAWWNTYALFVLLRHRPVLSVVGGLFRS
jgi:Zn-dependent peptidase ImmA (M78 family)